MKNSGVVWLIDAAYIFHGHGSHVDYTDMRRVLQEWAIPKDSVSMRFDEIIFYNSYVSDEDSRFVAELRRRGFEVKLYPLKMTTYTCDTCGHVGKKMVQRGVDVAICTDLLRLAYEGKFRRVVLSAGDGDLIDAVKLVKSRFQEVYLAGYRNSMSNDLAALADKIHWFS